jgi:rod shape-determining protein MreD
MGRYLGIPLLLIAVVVQSTVISQFRLAGGGVDVVFLLVVSWAMLAGVEDGLIWAVAGGVLQDLVAGTPLGMAATGLAVAVFAVTLFTGQVASRNIPVPPIAAAVGTMVYHAVLLALSVVTGQTVDFGYVLVYVTPPTAALNALFVLLVFRVLGRFYKSPRGVEM